MRVIQGKKVVLTGAAGGCGQALARRLAREGADLFLVDIDMQGLNSLAEACRGMAVDVHTACCDLTECAQISVTTRQVLDTWGALDILINNAGACYYGISSEMTADQWRQVMAVNLLAPIQLIHELLPALLSRSEAHVLNVSSVYGFVTTPRCAAYHASKFGLIGLSEALRMEYCRQGLGVTVLCPGFIRTDFFARASTSRANFHAPNPPKWICSTPDEFARTAVNAIRRNRRFVVVTALAHFVYWVRRLTPGLFDSLATVGRPKRKGKPLTQWLEVADRIEKQDERKRVEWLAPSPQSRATNHPHRAKLGARRRLDPSHPAATVE